MKRLFYMCVALATLAGLLPAQNLDLNYRLCIGCNQAPNADNATGTYTYGAITPYQSQDVTSDFGPRRLSGYDWHKGVDYKPFDAMNGGSNFRRGTAILSIVDGRVHRIQARGRFKYITIDGFADQDFGYAHIFNSTDPINGTRSGNLVLKPCDAPYPDYFAIIDLSSGVAISSLENLPAGVTPTVTYDGTSYTVQNTVMRNQMIAAMGGSTGSTATNTYNSIDALVHLHLYLFSNLSSSNDNDFRDPYPTRALNPLTKLRHIEPSLYTVKLAPQGQDFGQFVPSYPGINTNHVKVRVLCKNATDPETGAIIPETGYYPPSERQGNGIVNVDLVQLQLKYAGEAWKLIRGKSYRSEINYGSFVDPLVYPRHIVSDGISHRGTFPNSTYPAGIQGVDPYIYASHPYDDFYFVDFIPLIHRNDPMNGTAMIANCPMDARYNDGAYKLKAQLKTVRATSAYKDSPIQTFTLDNFQPFVQFKM